MNTTKYDIEDIARLCGVPVCLVSYYAQIGLLAGLEEPVVSAPSTGLELVDLEEFIQYATAARFSDEEIHCLLQLNDGADEKVLQLVIEVRPRFVTKRTLTDHKQLFLNTIGFCFLNQYLR